MYRIGIDVGSTYTKYCIMKDNEIQSLFMEKTPIRQKAFFEAKVNGLRERYCDAEIISCGYGKENVKAKMRINELIALSKGAYYATQKSGVVLDIGGQDSKIITQQNGELREFHLNDKCACGSGMFLINTLNMLDVNFDSIVLEYAKDSKINLSSTCAVFAQSEIVELIADGIDEREIVEAVIKSIFIKAKALLGKVKKDTILLAGGISRIPGVASFASNILNDECITTENGNYLAAIGCAIR